MKMYNTPMTPRLCGDCTDMMMRGPVCVLRETRSDISPRNTDTSDNARYIDCGMAEELSDAPLAIVTSPYQGFGDVYDCPREALRCGTLFANLYLPILDAGGVHGKGGCNI